MNNNEFHFKKHQYLAWIKKVSLVKHLLNFLSTPENELEWFWFLSSPYESVKADPWLLHRTKIKPTAAILRHYNLYDLSVPKAPSIIWVTTMSHICSSVVDLFKAV